MKIERLNENQIRCTLTRGDLASREIELTELAYGTEKARNLFHEMIEQAQQEFGFEAEDTPLIVEAIPLSSESLVLIITKVENPEELDTRFAKFAPPPENTLLPAISPAPPATLEEAGEEEAEVSDFFRCFFFPDLDSVSRTAMILEDMYCGSNTLYKLPDASGYCLCVTKSGHTPSEFNRVCNILSEYSRRIPSIYATDAYMSEHYEAVVEDRAIQVMARI
ncbi:MAG: adaptor protein MecA [Lachnospiraceae bacterium]|nr:adaptor protein MecA [Lachnospiraceae bacterium]